MWEWEPSNDVLSEWSSAMSLQLGQAVFSRTLRLSTSRLIYVLLCTEEVALTSKKKNVAILESVRLSVTVCSSAILLTFFSLFLAYPSFFDLVITSDLVGASCLIGISSLNC